MVLAMASDVFHTMFYGSGHSYEDVQNGEIVIKETTMEAFKVMLDGIYNTVLYRKVSRTSLWRKCSLC